MGKNACLLNRFSRVRLFATPWTVAHQAPLAMGFSRQEYWRIPPPPGGLPDPGIRSSSPVSPALAGGFFTNSTTCEVLGGEYIHVFEWLYSFPSHLKLSQHC